AALVTAEKNGDLRHVEVELVAEPFHVLVVIDVEVAVRVSVSYQELLQPQRRRRIARSDDGDVALALGKEPDPAQDERAHQDLANVGVRLEEGLQTTMF